MMMLLSCFVVVIFSVFGECYSVALFFSLSRKEQVFHFVYSTIKFVDYLNGYDHI